MVEDRKLAVLRAIVEVITCRPRSRWALRPVERHRLGVSPATVRNDMAALEDEGFITQPHTSAGRIPTDKGYRLFVDRLSQVKPLSVAEKRAISTLLQGAVDLDDVVQRSVRLLAQLTRQVAIVQYPTLSRSTVRHVGWSPGSTRLLLVLPTRVASSSVWSGASRSTTDLLAALNRATSGRLTRRRAPGELPGFEPGTAPVALLVARSRGDVDHRPERVVVGTNLARFGEASTGLSDARRSRSVTCSGSSAGHPHADGADRARVPQDSPHLGRPTGPGEEALATLGIVGPPGWTTGTMAPWRSRAVRLQILEKGMTTL
jgi:heat-inducible transcriptional repressor